jgi:hypothetical protein
MSTAGTQSRDALVMQSSETSRQLRGSAHASVERNGETAAMFMHNKRLIYTVRVGASDPKLANLILEHWR